MSYVILIYANYVKTLYLFTYFLFEISLPRAQFSSGNCCSMSPAAKTKIKVIFTMKIYMKTFENKLIKLKMRRILKIAFLEYIQL